MSAKIDFWARLGCWTALIGVGLAFWIIVFAGVIWWLR